jgi:hypothetical protein
MFILPNSVDVFVRGGEGCSKMISFMSFTTDIMEKCETLLNVVAQNYLIGWFEMASANGRRCS